MPSLFKGNKSSSSSELIRWSCQIGGPRVLLFFFFSSYAIDPTCCFLNFNLAASRREIGSKILREVSRD